MKQHVTSRVFMLMSVVAFAFALVGVAAPAHAQPVEMISACVGRLGLTRIVPPGAVCRPGEARVTWNIMGPPGADATRAAGPCFDNLNRYVDCGNGTVTDTVTGLIWLRQADCFGQADWATANRTAAGLKDGDCGLTDGSSPGDWRLPTNKEWETTMAQAKSMNCSYPTLTDDAGTACIKGGQSSFTGLESDYYWSNIQVEGGDRVYVGDLDHGNILNVEPPNPQRVWPVRGGQR